MTAYIESSAAVKLFVEEAESEALERYCDGLRASDVVLVSSTLLETELRRAAVRLGTAQGKATRAIERVTLINPDRAMFREAGVLPGQDLRSLDALHVATAVRAGVTTFITYDDRQRDAALAVGLHVEAPA